MHRMRLVKAFVLCIAAMAVYVAILRFVPEAADEVCVSRGEESLASCAPRAQTPSTPASAPSNPAAP